MLSIMWRIFWKEARREAECLMGRLVKTLEIALVKEGSRNLLMGTKLALLDASMVVS